MCHVVFFRKVTTIAPIFHAFLQYDPFTLPVKRQILSLLLESEQACDFFHQQNTVEGMDTM